MTTHFVTVNPVGKTIEVNEDDSLFTQLKQAGINVKSTCGGCASCGQCVIKIDLGEDFLNVPPFEEKQLLGNVFHITKERLACQTFVSGDVTIDVSDHIEIIQKPKLTTKVRKKADVEKVYEQRKIDREEKMANKPKRQGGNRRPKAFTFTDEDENKES